MNSQIHYCSMSHREIYGKLWKEAHGGTYTAYLRGKRCNTDEAFFREISASLQFPYYFGENWNALQDCLCDLDWLCFEKILIVVDDFGKAYSDDPQGKILMLKHFGLMVEYWSEQQVKVEIWLNN